MTDEKVRLVRLVLLSLTVSALQEGTISVTTRTDVTTVLSLAV